MAFIFFLLDPQHYSAINGFAYSKKSYMNYLFDEQHFVLCLQLKFTVKIQSKTKIKSYFSECHQFC